MHPAGNRFLAPVTFGLLESQAGGKPSAYYALGTPKEKSHSWTLNIDLLDATLKAENVRRRVRNPARDPSLRRIRNGHRKAQIFSIMLRINGEIHMILKARSAAQSPPNAPEGLSDSSIESIGTHRFIRLVLREAAFV
jgi:hypothetical protein